MRPSRIISGGQIGADIAALRWAISKGITHGGHCPRGRRSKAGPIAAQYQLIETASKDYPFRTKLNVQNSNATLIFTGPRGPGPGSKLTARMCEELRRPFMWVDPWTSALSVREWLEQHRPETLNVAGWGNATIEPRVMEILDAAID